MMAQQGGGWTNPYVTNGLVAMFDGEWNAGGGIHHTQTDRWIDLSGNGHDAVMNGLWEWRNDCCVFNYTGSSTQGYSEVSNFDFMLQYIDNMTVEIVGQHSKPSTNQYGAWFGIGYNNNSYRTLYADVRYYDSQGSFGGVQYKRSSWDTASKVGVNSNYDTKYSFSLSADGIGVTVRRNSENIKYINGYTVKPPHLYLRIGVTSLGQYMKGMVYTMRIYSRLLSTEEVAANYAVDKARFGLP